MNFAEVPHRTQRTSEWSYPNHSINLEPRQLRENRTTYSVHVTITSLLNTSYKLSHFLSFGVLGGNSKMDLSSLKDQVSNLTLYDLKAGVRKVQNGKLG